MPDQSLKSLPGAEIVLPGLADLEAGRESVNASAVQAAAHELYRQLSDELGDPAQCPILTL